MATRSRIGMEMPNGEVKSIYCHWDGYPEGVGAMLKEHYADPAKVEALIALGDISQLQPLTEPDVLGVAHSFNQPAPCVTVAYHRDRGEEFRAPLVSLSVESFIRGDIEQYGYVFTQSGEWKIFS